MNTILDIVYWLIIIQSAVIIHELGHYWVARAQGVGVRSYSVGMGPVLWRRTWRGTEWRLSALPIGGYVEIDGMVPDAHEGGALTAPTHGFARLRTLGKVAIMLAGPVMNLLLAALLLTANYSARGVTDTYPERVRISEVQAGSPAQRLGLRAGDVITAIDGQALPESYEVDGRPRPGYQKLKDTLGVDGAHRLTVQRGSTVNTYRFDWTAEVNGARQKLGVAYGPDFRVRPVGVLGAAGEAGRTIATALPEVLRSFGGLFTRVFSLDLKGDGNVVGPVGTVQVIGQAAKGGVFDLLLVAALINMSLAYFNLLPIPGLDGGRILLSLVQAVRRKPFEPAQEGLVNFAGLAFVMLLMLFVVVGDVVRLF